MRQLMHQGDEKSIFIQIPVNRDFMFFPIGLYGEITQFGCPWRSDGDVVRMLSEHLTSQSHCWFRNKPDQHIFQLIGWLRIQNKNY
jgi:hypothetical protein